MYQSFLISYFQEDVNVICVDWSAGAADPNYVRAAVNTRLVGKQVAILVEKINESIGKSITQRTHIVGFSLGAHVAGFAGTQLKNLSRITGKKAQIGCVFFYWFLSVVGFRFGSGRAFIWRLRW